MEAILQKAIKATGAKTQAEFAALLGKKQSYVSMLLHRVKKQGRPVPIEICPKIEAATGGKITCHDLRPDFFARKGRGRQ